MTTVKTAKATFILTGLTFATIGVILAALLLPSPWGQIVTLVLLACAAICALLERHWFQLACWAVLAAGIGGSVLMADPRLPALVQLLGILGLVVNMSYRFGFRKGAAGKKVVVGFDSMMNLVAADSLPLTGHPDVDEALRRAGVVRG
ncbi:hypothetical protein [Glutamicibacter sp. TV12E]|uniref:hypothetical protein n=1 Tax=Glutamicibacter sp. TV12E TaxID=3446362 RepID=UPI004034721B